MTSDVTGLWSAGRVLTGVRVNSLRKLWASRLNSRSRIAALTDDPLLLAILILAAAEKGASLVLFRDEMNSQFVEKTSKDLGLDLAVSGGLDAPVLTKLRTLKATTTPAGCVGIFTSGTSSSIPKLSWHDWAKVQAPSSKVPARLRNARWLMAYSPTSYAGLQVFFSAANSGGRLYFGGKGISEHPRVISRNRINVISGTPTYWRVLVASWPRNLPKPKLRQATLGGEAVDQGVLDLISDFFSPGKITHIYASTEAGTAIVVSDGREGFPAKLLRRSKPIGLRIVEGRLEVKTSGGMRGYAFSDSPARKSSWIQTPDFVEIRGDRVHFMGRRDGVINVGGMKINPESVEAAMRAIQPIFDCHVYARANAITGLLLCADVVLQPGSSCTAQEIKEKLRHAGVAQIPRMINVVNSLRTSPNGKKARILQS